MAEQKKRTDLVLPGRHMVEVVTEVGGAQIRWSQAGFPLWAIGLAVVFMGGSFVFGAIGLVPLLFAFGGRDLVWSPLGAVIIIAVLALVLLTMPLTLLVAFMQRKEELRLSSNGAVVDGTALGWRATTKLAYRTQAGAYMDRSVLESIAADEKSPWYPMTHFDVELDTDGAAVSIATMVTARQALAIGDALIDQARGATDGGGVELDGEAEEALRNLQERAVQPEG